MATGRRKTEKTKILWGMKPQPDEPLKILNNIIRTRTSCSLWVLPSFAILSAQRYLLLERISQILALTLVLSLRQ